MLSAEVQRKCKQAKKISIQEEDKDLDNSDFLGSGSESDGSNGMTPDDEAHVSLLLPILDFTHLVFPCRLLICSLVKQHPVPNKSN